MAIQNEPLLMIPVPVMLHPRVLQAMSRQMISRQGQGVLRNA